MYTIRIKGDRTLKNIEIISLYLVFYRTGYGRITKSIRVFGLYEDWDHKKQRFKENCPNNKARNHSLQKILLEYLKIADRWESIGKEWSPIELSHYYDEEQRYLDRYASVSTVMNRIIYYFEHRTRVKNGITITSTNTNNAKGYRICKGL